MCSTDVVFMLNRRFICMQTTLYFGSSDVIFVFKRRYICVQATLYLGSTEVVILFNRVSGRLDPGRCRLDQPHGRLNLGRGPIEFMSWLGWI